MSLWLRVASACMAGALLHAVGSLSGPRGWLGVFAASVLLLAAVSTRRRRWLAPSWGWVIVGLLAACLGGANPQHATHGDLRPGPGVAEGWIASAPETRARGDTAWLAVERWQGKSDDRAQTLALRFRLDSRTSLPPYGSHCRVEGTLRQAEGPDNFEGFDERGLLAAHAADGVLKADRVLRLTGVAGPAWRREAIEPLRRALARRMCQVLAPDEASLLQALVLGMDSSIDATLLERWRALGLAHVLAVSGMHVGLVAAGILLLVGAPRNRRALGILCGGVVLYAVLGGMEPSVLRACSMALWAAVAHYLGRPLGSALALLLTSASLLLAAPNLWHHLGFQLSCAATLGIVLWARPLQAIASRLRARRGGRIAAYCVGSAGISLAAQLSTLPLVLWKFGCVSRVGLLSNCVIVPLANGALVLGLAGAPWSFVWSDMARALWLLAGGLLHAAIRLGELLESVGELRWFLPTQGDVLVLSTFSSGAVLLAGACATSRRWRACAAYLSVALLASGGMAVVIRCHRSPSWRLEALDVGQGDALLLRLGEQAWLIDAGDAQPRDQGSRVVLPHLRRAGIGRLRGLLLTHPHRDHVGGARTVLEGIAVDTLYLAGASRGASLYDELSDTAVPQRWLQAGDCISLGADYEGTVLWPGADDSLHSGANGESLVLWGHGGEHPQLLAMGDLEADGEAALLTRWSASLRRASPAFLILKAGHHGSRTSSSAAFLDVIDAEVALVSVGRNNRYGHPAESTLQALNARHCLVLRTDVGGAIRVEQRGASLWLERPGVRARRLFADASTWNQENTLPPGPD